jgi:hypothetical protein
MCHRVESRLEGYHAPLSNFGNSGMKRSLADILHSCGTAKYNANIRKKIMVTKLSDDERKKVPAHFLNVPELYNHGELAIVNNNAYLVGVEVPPFKHVRIPNDDNGERFFSQYLYGQTERNITVAPHLNNDRCQCASCGSNPMQLLHEVAVPTRMLGLDCHDHVSETGAVSPKKKRRVTKNNNKESVSSMAAVDVVPMASGSGFNPIASQMMMQQQQYGYCMPPMMMNPFAAMSMMMMQPPPLAQQVRKHQQEYCCLPYFRYVTSKKQRVGRPPHDPFTCVKLNQFGKAPHK